MGTPKPKYFVVLMQYIATAKMSPPTKGRSGGYCIIFENKLPQKCVLLEKSMAASPNKILIGMIQSSFSNPKSGVIGIE